MEENIMPKKILIFTVVLLLALAVAAAPVFADSPPRFLQVELGNTLWEISRSTETSVSDWQECNLLVNPDRIPTGGLLVIPERAGMGKLEPTTPVYLPCRATELGPFGAIKVKVFKLDP